MCVREREAGLEEAAEEASPGQRPEPTRPVVHPPRMAVSNKTGRLGYHGGGRVATVALMSRNLVEGDRSLFS